VKRHKTPNEKLKRKDSSENLETESQSDQTYSSRENLVDSPANQKDRRFLIALIALLLGIYSSLESAHFAYSTTYYQYIELRISAPKAAQILSVMATSYTIGRGLSSFIAIKVKPEVMIIYHYFIIIIGMLVLYLGQSSIALIWFGNVIIGKSDNNFDIFMS